MSGFPGGDLDHDHEKIHEQDYTEIHFMIHASFLCMILRMIMHSLTYEDGKILGKCHFLPGGGPLEICQVL